MGTKRVIDKGWRFVEIRRRIEERLIACPIQPGSISIVLDQGIEEGCPGGRVGEGGRNEVPRR